MGLLDLICYFIYRKGKSYLRFRELKVFNKIATIHNEAIINPSARILNERSKESISIGKKSILSGDLVTFGNRGEIFIGDYCFIGENSRIWSAKKITIGNRVLIAHNVNIHDQNAHPLDSAERHQDQLNLLEGKGILSEKINEKEIKIEDDVWIGYNSSILKGVTIGKGAIIGSNSVITKDIPEYAIVVGNPPKIINYTQ